MILILQYQHTYNFDYGFYIPIYRMHFISSLDSFEDIRFCTPSVITKIPLSLHLVCIFSSFILYCHVKLEKNIGGDNLTLGLLVVVFEIIIFLACWL